MNKKLLSLLLIVSLVMLVGINVKAEPCANDTTDIPSAYMGCYPNTARCRSLSEDACKLRAGCSPTYSEPTTKYNGCTSTSLQSDCVDNGSNCTCPATSGTVNDTCKGIIMSPGGDLPANCSLSVSVSSKKSNSIKPRYSSSGPVSVDGNGNVTAESIEPGANNDCDQTFTVSFTVQNACGGTALTGSTSGKVRTKWNQSTTKKQVWASSSLWNQSTAEDKGYNMYYKTEDGSDCPGDGTECIKVTRGCGVTPPAPEPACYEDSDGLLWWDHDYESWGYNANAGKSLQYYSNGDWVAKPGYTRVNINKDKCYTKFKCSTKYPDAQTKTSVCNSQSDFTGNYIKQCGIEGGNMSKFYKITCTETMKTGFNGPIFNDSNYPNSFLYIGTAFKFNYEAKTKVECEGTWDDGFYQRARNYVNKYINDPRTNSNANSASDEYEGWTASAMDGVNKIADSYKNWKLNYYNSSKAETGVIEEEKPNVSGIVNTNPEQFTLDLKDGYVSNNTAVPDKDSNPNTCGSEPNGQLKNFTYKVVYKIGMQMPIVYYSAELEPHYVQNDETVGYESIGRVFPISDIEEYAGRNDYKYKVTVSNLGMGHKWTNDEECEMDVRKKETVFRYVNLSDPFIQRLDSGHQIGQNWLNSNYNFTGIIDENTWSNASQYNKVRIDQQLGFLIKEEVTRNQSSNYTGSCASQTSLGNTPTICSLLKQAKAGK